MLFVIQSHSWMPFAITFITVQSSYAIAIVKKLFLRSDAVIILRHILQNMTEKSSSHMERFFLPDVCQLRSRHIGKFVYVSEREIFLTKF